jgi:hypothetical protein
MALLRPLIVRAPSVEKNVRFPPILAGEIVALATAYMQCTRRIFKFDHRCANSAKSAFPCFYAPPTMRLCVDALQSRLPSKDVESVWSQVVTVLTSSAKLLKHIPVKQDCTVDYGANLFALSALSDGTGRELTFGRLVPVSP